MRAAGEKMKKYACRRRARNAFFLRIFDSEKPYFSKFSPAARQPSSDGPQWLWPRILQKCSAQWIRQSLASATQMPERPTNALRAPLGSRWEGFQFCVIVVN